MVGIARKNENSVAERRSAPNSIAATMLARERDLPQPHEIDREQRQDGAELDQHGETFPERLLVEAEEMADQQQMPGGGYWDELGQALDHAEEYRLEKIKQHEVRLRGRMR